MNRIARGIRWWLKTHQSIWILICTLLALGIIIVTGIKWHWWTWIDKNSGPLTVVVTFITGLALASFAGFTFWLSKRMVEFQHAPKLQCYSISDPETREFTEGDSLKYEGARWRVCLLNPGDVPVFVKSITVDISPASGVPHWTPVSGLCDFLDEEGHVFGEKPKIIVEGHGHRTLTVVWHRELQEKIQESVFRGQKQSIMMVGLLQKRQLFGQDKSGWHWLVSEKFELPSKFGKEHLFPRTY